MRFSRCLIFPVIFLAANLVCAQTGKPKVWIYSDVSDKTIPGGNKEGTVNDPDDISAMAGYLLLGNMFDTKGIVVASTHRKEHRHSADQGEWAKSYFGDAYQKDLPNLNRSIGGYPESHHFIESCIKLSAELYDPDATYSSLEKYPSVKALVDLAERDRDPEPINVLCWGSLTEPAILVNHCLATDKAVVLDKLRFIGHWTNSSLHQGSRSHPEDVANCREDSLACAYLKDVAVRGQIRYYECGAIGQHGIVSGSPKGHEYFDQFRASHLGRIFIEGKFAYKSVDHSDSATYWVLLGRWGVELDDISKDGTNPPATEIVNEEKFRNNSRRIHDELLRRSRAAAGPSSTNP